MTPGNWREQVRPCPRPPEPPSRLSGAGLASLVALTVGPACTAPAWAARRKQGSHVLKRTSLCAGPPPASSALSRTPARCSKKEATARLWPLAGQPLRHRDAFVALLSASCALLSCSGRERGRGGAQVEEAVALQAILGPDFEARGLGEVTAEAGEALLAAGPAAGGLRWRILVRPDLPAGGLALQARARGRGKGAAAPVAGPPGLLC
jgi:hypothetical protein